MKKYEYFLEKTDCITNDNWIMTLNKHGNQGWELSSIIFQDAYKEYLAESNQETENAGIINIIFKREY